MASCLPPSGRVALELVRDFLEFYDLRQTLAVFNPETHAAGVRRVAGRRSRTRGCLC